LKDGRRDPAEKQGKNQEETSGGADGLYRVARFRESLWRPNNLVKNKWGEKIRRGAERLAYWFRGGERGRKRDPPPRQRGSAIKYGGKEYKRADQLQRTKRVFGKTLGGLSFSQSQETQPTRGGGRVIRA